MAGDLVYAFRVMRLPLHDAGGATIGRIEDIVVVPTRAGTAPRVVGYVARNTVRVEIAKIDQAGPAIDVALASGANVVSSLRFYSSRFDEVRRQALEAAVAQARADAEVDAVHLTVDAYLSAAGRALPVELPAGGAPACTVLAGWDPDVTWWISDVLTGLGPRIARIHAA